MVSRGVRLLAALLVAVFGIVLLVDSPRSFAARGRDVVLTKEHLDLPFDAGGFGDEDEEEAPEVVFFYGALYDAESVVFCLDESKSMRKFNRWDIQLREIAIAISQLSKRSEFGIVFYGEGAYTFRSKLVKASPANKSAALAFLGARQLSLGTCLGPGINASLDLLASASSKRPTIIVAGDGRPTVCPFTRGSGEMSRPQMDSLLAETARRNPGVRARVHTIYVGADQDPQAIDFMRQLASRHRGTFRTVAR